MAITEELAADPGQARRWTGRLLMAVILGLAIWNLIVSVIDNVVVPGFGALMGQDGSLPASFTRNYDYPDLFVAVLKFGVAGIVAVSLNWWFQREKRVRQAVVIPRAPIQEGVPVTPVQAAVTVAAVAPPMRPVEAAAAQPTAPIPPVRPAPVVTPAAVFTPLVAVEPPRVVKPIERPVPVPVVAVRPEPVAPPPASPALAAVVKRVPDKEIPTPVVAKSEEKAPKKAKHVYYNIVGEPVEVDE